MYIKKTDLKSNEVLLLSSIWVSNIGEWIYFIALNLIVLQLTGSAIAVSVLYVLPYIATIITNSWAGSYIDRCNQKQLMIILDIARAIFIFLMAQFSSVIVIYLFSFIIQMMNSIFQTTSFACTTHIVVAEKQQRFNALKSFVQSSGFVIGPSVAGLLFLIGSPSKAMYVNGIALVLSAFLLSFVQYAFKSNLVKVKINSETIKEDWSAVYKFAKNNRFTIFVYGFVSTTVVLMVALDSLEAAFSTQTLGLTEERYGLLVSIAGLGVIFGSIINAKMSYKWLDTSLIQYGSIFTAIGYVIYAFATDFSFAAIGFFVLTFTQAFVNVGFLTFRQKQIPKSMLGRVVSVCSFFEAFVGVICIVIVGILTISYSLRILVVGISIIYVLSSFGYLIVCKIVKVKVV
ncbi:MFS transporter [Solibacillus sp. CAU 1738]|uniref:MFS transporter n=1 Tax=Solibacillus sp. CAU 1738 TaxID=3140363 RepID=UPI003261C92F